MNLLQNKTIFVYRDFLFILLIGLLIEGSPVYAAEYVYISDNLRVGVRTDPVSSVPPIGVVFTGMRLKVQERQDGYIKITTEKGVTGWIKDIYVTEKAPAIIQLNSLRAKYDKLKKELSQGNESTGMLEKANMALSEQLDELKKERREWQRERVSLMVKQYNDTSWFWVIWVVLLVIASFAGGAFWYRSQAMKRLGGLRV